MRTPFEIKNKEFTDKCHLIAQEKFYPVLFGTHQDMLEFVDTSLALGDKEQILDGQMAVDRIVRVTTSSLRAPLEFTVQERFRHPKFQHWQDVTITEWNHNSNLPSELYKLNAGIFVYGYANNSIEPTDFLEAYAVNTTRVLYLIATGQIYYIYGMNKKNQSFIGLQLKDLRNSGCMEVEYFNNTEQAYVPQMIDIPVSIAQPNLF